MRVEAEAIGSDKDNWTVNDMAIGMQLFDVAWADDETNQYGILDCDTGEVVTMKAEEIIISEQWKLINIRPYH